MSHSVALDLLRHGLVPGSDAPPPPSLNVEICRMKFSSPLGLAAGFDKDAVALAGLYRLGYGFVEAGTVTPRPQAGNPRPRLFRLAADGALINSMAQITVIEPPVDGPPDAAEPAEQVENPPADDQTN